MFGLFIQVKSGTIFDNLLISDDVKEAEEFGKQTWGVTKVGRPPPPPLPAWVCMFATKRIAFISKELELSSAV